MKLSLKKIYKKLFQQGLLLGIGLLLFACTGGGGMATPGPGGMPGGPGGLATPTPENVPAPSFGPPKEQKLAVEIQGYSFDDASKKGIVQGIIRPLTQDQKISDFACKNGVSGEFVRIVDEAGKKFVEVETNQYGGFKGELETSLNANFRYFGTDQKSAQQSCDGAGEPECIDKSKAELHEIYCSKALGAD